MATPIAWLRMLFERLAGRHEPDAGWVEPGNAITRSILSGAAVSIPEVEPSPLVAITAADLDLAEFAEKPIPPLGVEPPLVRPMVAPDWEPVATPTVAVEMPKPRVADFDADADAAEKPAERKRRRWWRRAA